MNNSGQISGEYLLIIGSVIFIMMLSAIFIINEQELTVAMAAARNGVNDGLSSSSAIYPQDTYREYTQKNLVIMHPYSVEIINVSYENQGEDSNYNKKKIQFKVYARADSDFSKKELTSIGDRINFNLRKSLAISFNTTSSTNKLYNPVFSPHYVFTTANVKWV